MDPDWAEMEPAPMPPLPPNRSSSNAPKVTFKGAQTWRESIGMFLILALTVSVVISSIILLVYVWRSKQLYEELVDFIDKTMSISKINFSLILGLYKLNDDEGEVLNNERTYKTIIRCYLLSELGIFVFLGIAALLYFTCDVSSGKKNIVYWVILGCGVLYSIIQVHMFTFALFPYSRMLPNNTEKLLNHAIPHNPGGLQQMEQRLRCTFDINLYAANRRHLNPNNTCDPQIMSSFIPIFMLIILLVIRLTPIVISFLLYVKRTPLSESIAQLIEKLRSNEKKRLYVKKAQRNENSEYGGKSTTFGVNTTPPRITSTPLPPVPSPAHVDHSVSYNNAAYFATSGAFSSRSSDVSRVDTSELFKNPLNHHASGSLQSEV